MTDLTIQSPVEIDTQIAALYAERYRQQDIADREWHYVRNYVGYVLQNGDRSRRHKDATKDEVREFLREYAEISESEEMQREAYPQTFTRSYAANAWERYLAANDAETLADEALVATEPFEAEYQRRGGWSRAFLVVTNGTGHVHRSMHCSTCYPTTRYHWVTEFSGKTEEEIVEAAGERACTVCYPSAPVEVLSRPTQMFTPEEQAAQERRAEREAKAAEKKAAEIEVVGYQESGRTFTKVFKTERAVTNALASVLGDLCWYGTTHPSSPEWLHNLGVLQMALTRKGLGYDYDKALTNARRKVTREGGTPKF